MKKQFAAYLLISAVLSGLFLALHPLPADGEPGLNVVFVFAIPIFLTQAGALWYFLTGLKTFQRGLKVAYYFLATGLFLFSLAQMQIPLTVLLGIFAPHFNTTILQLLLLIPFSLGTLVMYVAMRKFAKLLKVQSRWTSIWFVLGFVVLMVGASIFLPHPFFEELPEAQLDLLIVLITWSSAFSAAASVVAWRIRKTIGPSYKQASAWLAMALTVLTFAYVHVVLVQTVGAYANIFIAYSNSNAQIIPYAIASIFFLRAGQLFKVVGNKYGALSEHATALEVVVYTALLVSNPKDIDDTLDTVRMLTSTKKSGDQLTAEENTTLKNVYLTLEEYLITQEPLRKFTREGLRTRLPIDFQQLLVVVPPAAPVSVATSNGS